MSIVIFLILLVVMGIADAADSEKQKAHPALGNETTPQYMMELYFSITEDFLSEKLPFGAKSVRSFFETAAEDLPSNVYSFDLSNLKQNISTLQWAELHLYRKDTTHLTHPSYMSPFLNQVQVYQILPNKSLDEPHLHTLLYIHYVQEYAPGWLVFDVTIGVLSWLSNHSPNLGLLVVVRTELDDKMQINFVRRNQKPDNKQPILVLFNKDDDTGMSDSEDDEAGSSSWGRRRIISSNKIYEHAKQREDSKTKDDKVRELDSNRRQSVESALSISRQGTTKSKEEYIDDLTVDDTNLCVGHYFYADFKDTGLDPIIAAKSYYSNKCRANIQATDQRKHKKFEIIHRIPSPAVDTFDQDFCCKPALTSKIWILGWIENNELLLRCLRPRPAKICGCKRKTGYL